MVKSENVKRNASEASRHGIPGRVACGFLVVGLVLSGCADTPPQPPADESVLAPVLAPTPRACRTQALAQAVRGYLDRPERQTASDAVSLMEDGCADGDADVVWANGWIVLTAMEAAREAGTAGAPEDGAALANGVLEYMCSADASMCAGPHTPVVSGVFGLGGIFAVRGSGSEPVVANGAVPFTDFDNESNHALWGMEVTGGSWANATGVGDRILFYGAPGSSPLSTNEVPFADLKMDLHSFPDLEGFATNQVHVGVCYENDVTLPHAGGDEGQPPLLEILLRNGTLLQSHAVGCATWWNAVTTPDLRDALGSAVAFLARTVLPQPLAASLMTDRRAPSTGGSPIDFSIFAPVAADGQGELRWVVPPVDGDDDEPLAPIVVEALSGAGTPIELVEVTLHLVGNQGIPAGASFCDPADEGPCESPSALTRETVSGFDPVATFDGVLGDHARVWKPGGFTICARGTLAEFTFDEVCQVIHIKN